MGEDRGPDLAGVLGLFISLSWLFVLLRLYVKTFITKCWKSDDYLLITALIFFSTYCACSLSGVKYGTGRHTTNIPPEDIPKALYYWWLCELFYTVSTVFIRLSIAVFLLRICVKKTHKVIIYATLATIVAFSISYFFVVLFQCTPYTYFWRQYEPGTKGQCINPAVVPDASIAHSVLSFTADWILGLLPIVLIWDLKMNTRTKMSVAAILSLGLLAGIATMIRVPYIHVLALTDDFLFATTDVAIWSTIEPGLGIVAAGGATLRPLFRNFYALTTQRSQPKSPASRLQYVQQQSVPNSTIRHTKSTSSISDDIEMKGMNTTSIGASEVYLKTEKGGIKVQRTVEVTRQENEDGVSYLSEEETGNSWAGPSRWKDEKDMV